MPVEATALRPRGAGLGAVFANYVRLLLLLPFFGLSVLYTRFISILGVWYRVNAVEYRKQVMRFVAIAVSGPVSPQDSPPNAPPPPTPPLPLSLGNPSLPTWLATICAQLSHRHKHTRTESHRQAHKIRHSTSSVTPHPFRSPHPHPFPQCNVTTRPIDGLQSSRLKQE